MCELGCVVNSTFKFIKATPVILIHDDLPSRVCNPGLPRKYVTVERKGEQTMKVCSHCAKDPELGMEYCVNYNKQSGEYMEWLLASDIHERQPVTLAYDCYSYIKGHADELYNKMDLTSRSIRHPEKELHLPTAYPMLV